jgi:hypothetical protein
MTNTGASAAVLFLWRTSSRAITAYQLQNAGNGGVTEEVSGTRFRPSREVAPAPLIGAVYIMDTFWQRGRRGQSVTVSWFCDREHSPWRRPAVAAASLAWSLISDVAIQVTMWWADELVVDDDVCVPTT